VQGGRRSSSLRGAVEAAFHFFKHSSEINTSVTYHNNHSIHDNIKTLFRLDKTIAKNNGTNDSPLPEAP
jgi:hypothetical protein